MKKLINYFGYLILILTVVSCSSDPQVPDPIIRPDPIDPPVNPVKEFISIPSYSQRSGDEAKGYEYLTTGDYMSSGIPYDIFITANGTDNSNVLNRSGKNATITHELNAITLENGVDVVAPNCMQCHSTKINNELIIGLGNQTLDFTINRANDVNTLSAGITLIYGPGSKEWKAYQPFKKSLEVLGPKTITKVRGVNPADKTTVVLTSYRDKNTLEQLDEPQIEVSDEVLPSDIPAWWLLKKKNALFFHAIGREDYCRSMITMILGTLTDIEKAKEVDSKMPDILAYINSIEAPKYPFDIDATKAAEGEGLFNINCAGCHGSYGQNETYPNKLIALTKIGTDPHLSNYYTEPSTEADFFKNWFNTGWFSSGSNGLEVIAEGGYIAPPLDGVWATAPYFHNGSVPTIDDVLNSTQRPDFWRRSFNSNDYNSEKIGWNYSVETAQQDQNTYNTTLKGYGNGGHPFGDNLSASEREAVLEYLKTL